MNMGVAGRVRGYTSRGAGTGGQSFPDELFQREAIKVLLVEDDAPTLGGCGMRLQGRLSVSAAGTLAEARACLAGGRAAGTAHRSSIAGRTWRRPDPRDAAAISRHRDHGDLNLGDEESVISAITVGATGYCSRTRFRPIAATVRDLVAGHSPISASIARFIVRRTQKTPTPAGPALNTAKLTPREIDILWGIAKGLS